MSSSNVSESAQLTGKVKWFNNKAGFGFITVCDGEFTEKDIFVHYSAIQVKNSQYKYLVQGEYVDFSLTKPEKGAHEFHAVNVCGIKGGSLMCETRRQNFTSRPVRSPMDEQIEKREVVSREVSRDIVNHPSRRPAKVSTRETEDGFQKVYPRRISPATTKPLRKTREVVSEK